MRHLFAALLAVIMTAALSSAQAAMDVSREIVTPKNSVPGQPVTVAVTYWTDSWFNPPPAWPDFPVRNGEWLATPQPNQLQTRLENGVRWSGIRFERQLIVWDQGTLLLPAVDVTLDAAGQPPATVHLKALSLAVAWPKGVEQPDRFLPASHLTLTQTITQYHTGDDAILRAGDAVERKVKVQAQDVAPMQIPQILFAIPGENNQQLAPETRVEKTGRGDIAGVVHIERLRYLPTKAGKLTLPPVKLRWWDSDHQRWQLATLPGQILNVSAARAAGEEATLSGHAEADNWPWILALLTFGGIAFITWVTRRSLRNRALWVTHRWQHFWRPVSLAELAPPHRKKR